jgi:hypothetical protein
MIQGPHRHCRRCQLTLMRNFLQKNLAAEGHIPLQRIPAPRGRRQRQAPSQYTSTQSPLTTIFPTTRTIGPVGFLALLVPSAFQTKPAATTDVLFHCLLDFEPAKEFGQECTLIGALCHLSSLGKTLDGVNRPSEVQIGFDTIAGAINPASSNLSAAIIIGSGLNVSTDSTVNRWSVAGASIPIPGLDLVGLSNGSAETVDNSSDRYIHYEYFPPGDFQAAATCQRITTRPIFAPYVHRFTAGRRLQVVLACNSLLWGAAGSDKFIYAHASVSLIMGLTQNDRSFTPENAIDNG